MKTCIIRLPGGGQIKSKKHEDILPWRKYRNFEIDTTCYEKAISLIRRYPDWNFVFTSGGVGAFIYINLGHSLGLPTHISQTIGCEIVSLLNKIIISHFAENSVAVLPTEVEVSMLRQTIASAGKQCFFLKPDPYFHSTDSLAVHAAINLESDVVLFLKTGVPIFHVGFDEPTRIDVWAIDDLIMRARHLLESKALNYILDYESTLLIKEHKLTTFLLEPSKISEVSFDDGDLNIMNKGFATKIRV